MKYLINITNFCKILFYCFLLSSCSLLLAGCATKHLWTVGERVEESSGYTKSFIIDEKIDQRDKYKDAKLCLEYTNYKNGDEKQYHDIIPIGIRGKTLLRQDCDWFEGKEKVCCRGREIKRIFESYNEAKGIPPEAQGWAFLGASDYKFVSTDKSFVETLDKDRQIYVSRVSFPKTETYHKWWSYPLIFIGTPVTISLDIINFPINLIYSAF